jgi:hypothetical protein
MELDKEELTARFRQMSDDALLGRLTAGALTAVASEVALAELASRGIALPEPAVSEATEVAAPEELPELPLGVELVTIAHFLNPLHASVVRSQLESEGIFVHLWGEHLGIAHIVFSAATGGMRLQVRSDQAERARAILAAIDRGDYALDDEGKSDRS